jgi:hypothetical protein
MNIRIKPSAPQGKDFGLNHGAAGKGDTPRNLSRRFRDNYAEINWGGTGFEERPAKWRKVYR